MTFAEHGLSWRFNELRIALARLDIDYHPLEPRWQETDLTPEQVAEVDELVAEHLAERSQDGPLFARWAVLEHNGVDHTHRRGKVLRSHRPAYGYQCSMCGAAIINANPGDFLFRGGPLDGQWRVTDGSPTWIVPVSIPIVVIVPADTPGEVDFPTVEYRLHGEIYYAER